MTSTYSTIELEAYLDEALSSSDMAAIEKALREQPELVEQLAAVNARRDAGIHSLGEIWRTHRLTCPTRRELGDYLLGVLAQDVADYVRFHLEQLHCRQCTANANDLAGRQRESTDHVQTRRRKYFQSSAGYLRHE